MDESDRLKLLQQARRTWVEPVTTSVIKSFTPSEWGKLVLGFATAILTHPPDSKIVGFALSEQQSAMFTTNDLQPLLMSAFRGSAMSNANGWTLEGCVALKGVKSIYIEGEEVRRRLGEDLKQQISPLVSPLPIPNFTPSSSYYFPTFPQWRSYKCVQEGCNNTVFSQGSRCGIGHTPPTIAVVSKEQDPQPPPPAPPAPSSSSNNTAAQSVTEEEEEEEVSNERGERKRKRGATKKATEPSPPPPPPKNSQQQQPIPPGQQEVLIKDFFSLYCDVRPGAKETLVPAEVWVRFCHWLTRVSRYGLIPMDLPNFKKCFEKIYPDHTKHGVYVGFVIANIPGLPVYPFSKRGRN